MVHMPNISKVMSSNKYAFVALTMSRTSLFSWGHGLYGAQGLVEFNKKIKKVVSNDKAFLALIEDGTVYCWGDNDYGGDSYSLPISDFESTDKTDIFNTTTIKLNNIVTLTNVKEIYSTPKAYVALKNDNTVSVWGDANYGGHTTSVSSYLTDINKIYSTDRAFAALKNDGKVFVWGNNNYGGNYNEVSSLTDVKEIYNTKEGFLTLKNNNTINTWGIYKNIDIHMILILLIIKIYILLTKFHSY